MYDYIRIPCSLFPETQNSNDDDDNDDDGGGGGGDIGMMKGEFYRTQRC